VNEMLVPKILKVIEYTERADLILKYNLLIELYSSATADEALNKFDDRDKAHP